MAEPRGMETPAAMHAYRQAGYAVAGVARGCALIERGSVVNLDKSGKPDLLIFQADPERDDPDGFCVYHHDTPIPVRPFVTFAGPYAEAKWIVESDPDCVDIYDVMERLWYWDDSYDRRRYLDYLGPLFDLADEMGLPLRDFGYFQWELCWEEELDDLWPAIREVAASMLRGDAVTNAQVLAALNRNPPDEGSVVPLPTDTA